MRHLWGGREEWPRPAEHTTIARPPFPSPSPLGCVGVGKLFHCSPTIPHYANNKAKGIMRPGCVGGRGVCTVGLPATQRVRPTIAPYARTLCRHVFTIEPMINEGSAGDETWPDKWTAVTRDGKRSSQETWSFHI